MTELDASINNCRRLNDTLFLITYSLSTLFHMISALSKQIHSTVARYYFNVQEVPAFSGGQIGGKDVILVLL